MKRIVTLFVTLFLLIAGDLMAQGGASSCAELEANYHLYQSCATNVPFSNSTGGNSETFNTTCINAPFRGPTWFFIQIQNNGPITLQITQTSLSGVGTDVDFVLWGPFNNLTNICSQLDIPKEVDCSWSPSSVENVNIPNGISGQLYVLLIDNYSNVPGNIQITQIAGTGSSNCDFLSSVDIVDTSNQEITQFDYCKPQTKDIVARVDTSDFPGAPANLRFNYTWYKNGVLLTSTNNSTSPTNALTVSDTGIYKVTSTTYDITTNPTGSLTGLRESNDEINLKFHTAPIVNISNTDTQCLNTNPTLNSTITNSSLLNNTVDILTYQWFLNNVAIVGATSPNYTPTLEGDYFVRAYNNPCLEAVSNTIHFIASPENMLDTNPYIICIDKDHNVINPAIIDTHLSGSDFSFVWYNGFNAQTGNELTGQNSSQCTISTEGEYSVKVTTISSVANCSSVFNFSTKNSFVPFSITASPSELIAYRMDNTVTAIAFPSSEDYLYSVNNRDWQTSNVFTNLHEGEYILKVKSRYGCGEIGTSFRILAFPNFFTPNGDGYNDTWNIIGSNILDAVRVLIFDRYGKLLKELNPSDPAWDGTFNGGTLPSDDYWYKLIYTKNNVTKELRGHFAMKR